VAVSDRARRPGPTVRLRVEETTHERTRQREDRVVTEEPLEIRVASPGAQAQRVWVTMRTPGQDFELAAGFLVHEAIVRPEWIRQVAYCTDESLDAEQEFNVVTVNVDRPVELPERTIGAQSSGSSACGVCGKDSVAAALASPPVSRWEGADLSADVVRHLPGALRERQSVFAKTGGAHAAALASSDGTLWVVREDVGRHNAVDKVTGARVLAGQSPAEAALVVSGRAGFELVQKAAAAGVGALVAVGAPTSLSVSLAERSGLALFGFTDESRTVRYA
jgi:FdhD protein